MKKYIVVLLCLGAIKLFNLTFFTNEISLTPIVSQFASNLYQIDETVGVEDIEVLDYEVLETGVWITPIRGEVILPIGGMVTKVQDNFIEIESPTSTYQIYEIKPEYHLYQYYKNHKILGSSSRYFIQTTDIPAIVSKLTLSYETI